MPTRWRNLEPPIELSDRVPHTQAETLVTKHRWRLTAASRRGKIHAHRGLFRDDAYALGYLGVWHFMVVADGGSSQTWSRVGANLAAQIAVRSMLQYVKMADSVVPVAQVAKMALREGLIQAWQALAQEAKRRQIKLRELGTTFLCVIHRPLEQGSLIGVIQVGDGLLAAKVTDNKVITFTKPDMGQKVGSTLFLTSLHWQEWIERVSVGTLDESPQMIVAMCDGVANDFMPFDKYLTPLFKHLNELTHQAQTAEMLLKFLNYEKRGSFDDRTLAILYRV